MRNAFSFLLGKLFASSSFYSPTIHPTVEDQVELARRISHSLSDISNQQSKGQSMYVNRKKRSVKWIHDDGHEEERFIDEGIFQSQCRRSRVTKCTCQCVNSNFNPLWMLWISHCTSSFPLPSFFSVGSKKFLDRHFSFNFKDDDSTLQSSFLEHHETTKENGYETSTQLQSQTQQLTQINGSEFEPKKVPLKLVMDPRHVQDLNSMRQFGYEPSAMSPEFGYELVNALNAPKGKGEKFYWSFGKHKITQFSPKPL